MDFRMFLGNPKAEFRCPEQGELIELLQTGSKHILGILGCNFGKTLFIFFHVAVYAPQKVCVVFLPFLGLHQDFASRAHEHGIKAARWTDEMDWIPDVQVLYISPEDLNHDSLITYVYCTNQKPISPNP